MDFMNRDSILGKASGLKTAVVEALGGKVLIRELSAGKAAELYESFKSGDHGANVSWVIASVVDPQLMVPIFEEKDRPTLNELSFVEISKISKAAIELNGLTSTEETEKNSAASRNGASNSV